MRAAPRLGFDTYAHDLERIHQLRPRQHPDRVGGGASSGQRHVLPHPPPRVRDADQAEAVLPLPRARCRSRRARQGLGVREGPVRDGRGVRSRGGRAAALAVDRHPPLRPDRARSIPSTSTAPITSRRPTQRRSGARMCSCSAPCRTRRWRRSASSFSGARKTSASSARSATRSRSRRSTTPRTSGPGRSTPPSARST